MKLITSRSKELKVGDYIKEIDMELESDGVLFVGKITRIYRDYGNHHYNINYEIILTESRRLNEGDETLVADKCEIYKLSEDEVEDLMMAWRI